MTMMMAVRFTIRSYALKLRLRVVFESRFEARRENLAGIQQSFKGDCPRCGPIVKEDRNRHTRLKPHQVWMGGVYRIGQRRSPGRIAVGRILFQRTDTLA